MATAELNHEDDVTLGSEAFKAMSINSLLALGLENQDLARTQLKGEGRVR